ncbi:hypothetical protein OD91_0164 [Lutibacter sp. Hel_I_33_5]|uniref:hypothetical protein n=1 Tax=Lutibacter sp. Hel_I_33_5 TaxID=1566289 RepID=UPI0011A24498|nr:hypothetical protein [Lutibacter sp. Hel_I_33_5]TVZ54926.1 hypothetical protein OD91_0164 [Lutibacter sp. Hel_I_33_5]
MKSLNNITKVIFAIIFLINSSCSKEDSIISDTEMINSIEVDSTNDSEDISASLVKGAITLYTVNGTEIEKKIDYAVSGTNLALQKNIKKHDQVWNFIKKVTPTKYLSMIKEFLVFNGEAEQIGGFVTDIDNDLSKWTLGIAIEDIDGDGDLIHIVLHEVAHIITLKKDQVDENKTSDDCKTIGSYSGCVKGNSYLYELYVNYWGDIKKDREELSKEQLYQKYPDRFVTEYAATNPGEDIAEVITEFIKQPKSSNTSIANKKINSMYNHSEIVDFRNYVISNINTTSGSRLSRIATNNSKRKKHKCGRIHKGL